VTRPAFKGGRLLGRESDSKEKISLRGKEGYPCLSCRGSIHTSLRKTFEWGVRFSAGRRKTITISREKKTYVLRKTLGSEGDYIAWSKTLTTDIFLCCIEPKVKPEETCDCGKEGTGPRPAIGKSGKERNYSGIVP